VRLAAVQIDRNADDRDVGHHEGVEQDLPPGKVEQSVGEKIKRGIQQGNLPVEAEKMAGRKTSSTCVGRVKGICRSSIAFYFKRSKSLCQRRNFLIDGKTRKIRTPPELAVFREIGEILMVRPAIADRLYR
jgi:hypothetical protein